MLYNLDFFVELLFKYWCLEFKRINFVEEGDFLMFLFSLDRVIGVS